MSNSWEFDHLKSFGYDGLIIDPPTRFEVRSEKGLAKSPQAQYDTMSWDDLGSLPVQDLCRGDALVMLWACWPTLQQSLKLMDDWGFRYVTGGSWHKKTKHGKTQMGTGYRLRSATEPYLIGTLGAPSTANNVRNIINEFGFDEIEAENLGHSRKPDAQYAYMEQLLPGHLALAELFSRKSHPGWDSWGLEAGKFDEDIADGTSS